MDQAQQEYLKYLQAQHYPELDKIKAVLLKGGFISDADSSKAEKASHDSTDYVDFLVRQELLTKPLLGQALAECYELPFADLVANPVSESNVRLIDEDTARSMRLTVAQSSELGILVVTDRPEAIEPKKVLALFPGRKVRLAYTLPECLEAAFELYEQEQALVTRFSDTVKNSRQVAPEIVDEIIEDALGFRASDIHFEPHSEVVTVRFRVDGVLRMAGELPKKYYESVLNRIKAESGMLVDEHLALQAGVILRDSISLHGDCIGLSVSLAPTVEGEKVVMRILRPPIADFAEMGMSSQHRTIVERCIAQPFGMILTVGPSGSGKTSTLYSLLELLNKPDVSITTIEDPVEYKMDGVNQIQVRADGGVTFAKGLRSIMRQDPDIILVGEMRDRQTAEISLDAALTGHLLLSTFRADDAATVIPRLLDMGIEPFLLASTLKVIIAQRLVRGICTQCRYSLPVGQVIAGRGAPGIDWADYFNDSDALYAGRGCKVCKGSGYAGRVSLFELIEVTPEMRALILDAPSSLEIATLARSQSGGSMFEDGLDKVRSGSTTLAEVLRVVPLWLQSSQAPAKMTRTEPGLSAIAPAKLKTKPRTSRVKPAGKTSGRTIKTKADKD